MPNPAGTIVMIVVSAAPRYSRIGDTAHKGDTPMAFANLSRDDQLDQVSNTLQALLGEKPSHLDYIMLCRATRAIVEALEVAIMEHSLAHWEAPLAQQVSAA